MRYEYTLTGSKKLEVKSGSFPKIIGKGHSEDIAFTDFFSKALEYLQKSINQGKSIPNSTDSKRKGISYFTLPFNLNLKLQLQNLLIKEGISRPELARLLAITPREVKNNSWSLENLQSIRPRGKPKYKKVERLFNLSHDSSLKEIEDAYKVLGYFLEISPKKRN